MEEAQGRRVRKFVNMNFMALIFSSHISLSFVGNTEIEKFQVIRKLFQ